MLAVSDVMDVVADAPVVRMYEYSPCEKIVVAREAIALVADPNLS